MKPPLKAEFVFDGRAQLGECPLWHPQEHVLYWVDISGKTINRFDPALRTNQAWPAPTEPGCIALRKAGGLIAACRDGFYAFDTSVGIGQKIADAPYDMTNMRFNDGKCDALGRFWAGAMFEPRTEAAAAMFVLAKGKVQTAWGPESGLGVKVSNGLAFDNVRGLVYQSDTPNHIAYRFPFDTISGSVGERQIFFTCDADKTKPGYAGRPDGATIDLDGNYWSAHYEGGRVVCYSPDGVMRQAVMVAAKRTTMATFGGADYKTMYITTAREGASADELAMYPHSGGLFAVHFGLGDTGAAGGKAEPFYVD
ncbi:MAG: SMP-30/gluconolactonase/LRE family protein [Burkholderiales bacterium]